MKGAITGDIIGSVYEFDRSPKIKNFGPLFSDGCMFTDDSVMTVAVAEALLDSGKNSGLDTIRKNVIIRMREWGALYPDAGYGGRFICWLNSADAEPYNSLGNGSAMRVSAVGYYYDTLERTLEAAEAVTDVTHNHPEGITGAKSIAAAIFLARNGKSKQEIKKYISENFGYDFSRTLDEIRPYYRHVESCRETVPEALTAFFESEDFEDCIRNAVSLGGDCDTLTAIACSVAEAYYGIPDDIYNKTLSFLSDRMKDIINKIYR